ncbi:SufS family cysteine desulfurase [Solirubrobacter sp. CPCC 204708]|uniref:Cysteine desulfurase n=1 Tax=Solirubrobacter deserti TaxID=2282478 RepID=A0ABT4RLF8_9ACTN|nr:SufS family cysteine desulfurase [Solirubrobacter deserti]MBE2319058.1 SufS family cysteine desulfurase [Solirubrobacter deserti]MDA0139135.1 SufS family cysteine desulfurase [Solirubrobacter deserti]
MSLAVPTSAEFPVLAREGLVYLDTAATSQTVRPALEAMDRYYETYRASIHRGVYPIAAEATEAYEVARRQVAEFVNSTPGETVFTRNATEAINLVAYSWGRANVGPDDLVLISQMEHHSNLVPWQLLGCRLAYIPMLEDGTLDLDEYDRLLERSPKLVAVTHVSNVVGTINPIAEITRRAHAGGALVLADGAQAVPSLPVDVAELDVDFYAWTGHKAYGPTGIGVLHGKRELLEAMPPFLGGGHMITRVGDFESQWAEPPAKFEAGTMPVAEAIGLGAAVEWLSGIGMENVREHGRDVTAYALERLSEVPGLTIHGSLDPDVRGALVTFVLDYAHPHDVAEILGRQGVCVRAGHHCAQVLMRRLGSPASTRASFAVHATREDVDRMVDALGQVHDIFG